MLEALRERVWAANLALPANNLVLATSGNVSGRDADSGLVVIKPSGVAFDRLEPHHLVIVDDRGEVVEGELKPSVDTASHLVVYRERPDVMGIVHTHSPYATSFAVRGEPLPIYTTTSAAVFGGAVPISDFAAIGGEAIGGEIVAKIGEGNAILLRSHGVFTIGASPEAALKYAIVLEETAQVVHYSLIRGPIEPLSDEIVRAGYREYRANYGQDSPD